MSSSPFKDIDLQPAIRRFEHFIGTSPDEAGNRRRLIFFLIFALVIGIAIEIFRTDDRRFDIIKEFTSTIVWLVGIYVGGSVAAKLAGEPQSIAASPREDKSNTPNTPRVGDAPRSPP